MIIRGIFTNTKLSPERMNSETTVPYIVANECPGLKRGDLVQLVGYDSKFQVVWTYASSREQESYETVTISEINGKQINTIGKNISSMEQFGKMDMSDVFGDLTKDMYDDFMPQAEEGAKISITDGVLCFKNSDGAEKWDIYHIHVEHGGYYGVERVSNSWKPYVGDNLIISDKEHVGESIARIVSNSYGQQTNS